MDLEVDVIGKLPPNFYSDTGVESKKWQERKDALQGLADLLGKADCLDPKSNYGELVGTLSKLLEKDANINVQALAAKCLAGIAAGLRKKFGSFAATVFPVCIDKLKEKKPLLRNPLVEAMDAVFASTTFENIEEAVTAGLENKNPQIKAQTACFLYRSFKSFTEQNVPKKSVKAVAPLLIKLTSDADIEVRNGSSQALGSIMRAVGPVGANMIIKDISDDKSKMDKINSALEQARKEVAEELASAEPPCGSSGTLHDQAGESVDGSSEPVASSTAPQAETDPFEFLDPFDLVSKLPPSFYADEGGVSSKKWQERKEALEAALKMMTDNPKLEAKANYGQLVETLSRLLGKDANINVAALAARCIGGIACGLRTKFAPHVPTVFPVILEKFKEKKAVLKDPLTECVDSVGSTVNLETLEESVMAAMENKNPQIKAQTDLFLARAFRKFNPQTMPKKTLKNLCPLFVKHTAESDVEVREGAYSALGAAMRVTGEKAIATLCSEIADDKLKMTKITEACQKLVGEIGPCIVSAPPTLNTGAKKEAPKKEAPKSAQPKASSKSEPEDIPPERPPSVAEKKLPKKGAADQPKEEVVGDEEATKKPTAALAANSDKAQRMKDEAALKLLKWNFATPTEEHIQQLNALFALYAKTNLMGMLFSKDFKQHIKACDELTKLGDESPQSLVSNSDLILKWCTLRFFETNPSALIKVLELALRVVREYAASEEQMSTSELNSFLPYLVTKSGEQKENMRVVVRDIINELTDMCGPFKLAPALLDGLKTKNARQRTEILLVLENYISGGALPQLKPMAPIKAIASCVGDADKNVRSAAINAMVAAYRVEGDSVWKAAGKMVDKDRAMVDERIKRTGAVMGSGSAPPNAFQTPNKGARVVSGNQTPVVRGRAQARSQSRDPGSRAASPENTTYPNQNELMRTMARPNRRTVDPNSTTFALDDEFLEPAAVQIREARRDRVMNATLQLNEMERTMRRPDDLSQPVLRNNRNSVGINRASSVSSIASSIETLEQLEKTINDAANQNPSIARDAIAQLMFVSQFPDQLPLLHERVDMILQMLSLQIESCLKTAAYSSVENCGELVKHVFNLISKVFMSGDVDVLQHVSTPVAESLMAQLIQTVSSQALASAEDFTQLGRTANVIVIRMVKQCRPAVLFEATTSNMVTSSPKKESEWGMLLRILYRFGQSCEDLGYVARIDLRQYFIAASTFMSFLEKHLTTTYKEQASEAMDQLKVSIERIVTGVREQALDTLRRIPRPHAKIAEQVNRLLVALKDVERPQMPANLPGQVESPTADFSMERFWSLLHQVGVDFKQLPRTVPAIVEYYKKYPLRQAQMKQKMEQYLFGEFVLHFVNEYACKGDAIVWPSARALEAQNSTRTALLECFGELAWGERVNPLVRRPDSMTNDATNANFLEPSRDVTLTFDSAPVDEFPVAAVEQRPALKNKQRRTIDKSELEQIRARLNRATNN